MGYNNGQKNRQQNREKQKPVREFRKDPAAKVHLGKRIDDLSFAEVAEEVMKTKNEKNNKAFAKSITANQIRKLHSYIIPIYEKVRRYQDEFLPEELRSDLQYLKIRFAYEFGRENGLKNLNSADIGTGETMLDLIDKIGDSREKCLLFCRYMESLVAFHKLYGDK